jgi:hypothetical protein
LIRIKIIFLLKKQDSLVFLLISRREMIVIVPIKHEKNIKNKNLNKAIKSIVEGRRYKENLAFSFLKRLLELISQYYFGSSHRS